MKTLEWPLFYMTKTQERRDSRRRGEVGVSLAYTPFKGYWHFTKGLLTNKNPHNRTPVNCSSPWYLFLFWMHFIFLEAESWKNLWCWSASFLLPWEARRKSRWDEGGRVEEIRKKATFFVPHHINLEPVLHLAGYNASLICEQGFWGKKGEVVVRVKENKLFLGFSPTWSFLILIISVAEHRVVSGSSQWTHSINTHLPWLVIRIWWA